MKPNRIVRLLLLLPLGTGLGTARAQSPELQQKIAEVKQAAAANKQALAQFTWVEQVTISLKGEQKKQEHFQVRLGPDGKPQKQSLDPPAQSAAQRGGRVKEHVVEKKTEEYKDYADQIKSLIEQYVPPDKEMLEQAAQKGNVALSPAPGAQGQYRLAIINYKAGEAPAAASLASVSVAPRGSKPSGIIVETTAISGKILAIDADKPKITFGDPEGKKKTVKVRKSIDISGLAVGESVDAVLTESVAIDVSK